MLGSAAAQPALEKADLETTIKDFQQLDGSQKNAILGTMGVPEMPSADSFTLAKIIAWLIFGAVGGAAFIYGKKMGYFRPLILGIALMGYPYFTNNTIVLYVVGVGLCAALYFWRE